MKDAIIYRPVCDKTNCTEWEVLKIHNNGRIWTGDICRRVCLLCEHHKLYDLYTVSKEKKS